MDEPDAPPLHLIKLCVGAENIADLEEWVKDCLRRSGEQVHTTRMMPKRRVEILAGGSLYWVIRGVLSCRQTILDLRATSDGMGVSYCDIVLEPRVVPVDPRPRGPFQGWRYLAAKDAPPDLDLKTSAGSDLPIELSSQLRAIGLL